jgi:hypothetical protein
MKIVSFCRCENMPVNMVFITKERPLTKVVKQANGKDDYLGGL